MHFRQALVLGVSILLMLGFETHGHWHRTFQAAWLGEDRNRQSCEQVSFQCRNWASGIVPNKNLTLSTLEILRLHMNSHNKRSGLSREWSISGIRHVRSEQCGCIFASAACRKRRHSSVQNCHPSTDVGAEDFMSTYGSKSTGTQTPQWPQLLRP